MTKRIATKVCGSCWYSLRPDQYEPFSGDYGKCSMCGDTFSIVHRVSRREVESYGNLGYVVLGDAADISAETEADDYVPVRFR